MTVVSRLATLSTFAVTLAITGVRLQWDSWLILTMFMECCVLMGCEILDDMRSG